MIGGRSLPLDKFEQIAPDDSVWIGDAAAIDPDEAASPVTADRQDEAIVAGTPVAEHRERAVIALELMAKAKSRRHRPTRPWT